jgi:hypothetical protein
MQWGDEPGRWWRWLCGRCGPPPTPLPRMPGDLLTEPVHQTILALVIDGFSAASHTNMHRLTLRAGLYRVVEQALIDSGVNWRGCHRTDLGDGVLLLIPAAYPKAVFSELVPGTLSSALADHNGAHQLPEKIRLRAALHAGEVSYDAYGATGAAIVHVFRLLRSRVLNEALAYSSCDLTMIASAWFYEEIIRHSPASRPDRFRPVLVREKETATQAWVRTGAGEEDRRLGGHGRFDDCALG